MTVSASGIIIGIIAVIATGVLIYFMTNKKLPNIRVDIGSFGKSNSTASSSVDASSLSSPMDPHPLHI